MFTVGEIETVCERLGKRLKDHEDIPWVVQVAYQAGILRDPMSVTWCEGELIVQLRISDQLHLTGGWMPIQYVPMNFRRSTPDVVLDILVWVHEEAQKLITAHRLYHEGIPG